MNHPTTDNNTLTELAARLPSLLFIFNATTFSISLEIPPLNTLPADPA